jgi:hypothetical protein
MYQLFASGERNLLMYTLILGIQSHVAELRVLCVCLVLHPHWITMANFLGNPDAVIDRIATCDYYLYLLNMERPRLTEGNYNVGHASFHYNGLGNYNVEAQRLESGNINMYDVDICGSYYITATWIPLTSYSFQVCWWTKHKLHGGGPRIVAGTLSGMVG